MLPMSVYPNRARTSVQHSLTLCGNCDTFITKYRGLFMATIKEIAALAGVSRGTVDRVLNDRGAVNPETAEKIRKIAKELDYKKDPVLPVERSWDSRTAIAAHRHRS
jgi:transcriptional regulator with XRE-family HTH domain